MKQRVLGFTLVAVSIVGALAAFATAEDYEPRLGIVNATQRAYVWTSCVRTPSDPSGYDPDRYKPNWSGEGTCHENDRKNYFTISLATTLTTAAAVGLAGVGLLVFGRR